MPVALATASIPDGLEVEAEKFQKVADRAFPLLAATIAAILRDGRAAVASDLIVKGVEQDDFTLIREGIPELARTVRLVKADEDDLWPPPLGQQLASTFGAGSEFALRLVPDFELVDRNAVTFARERAGALLTDLDGWALTNAREAVAFGIENGRTVAQTSRFLEQSLFLPPRAMNAVENYFHGLIDRLEKGDDLQEAARHAGKHRALAPKKFLDAKNVDTLVSRYADRWVTYTARTTARTMTIEASNAGLRDGWNQAARAGLFSRERATLVWFASGDDRVCPECSALNGIEVAFVDGTWETSTGNAFYPPAHPACRCTLVLVTGESQTFPIHVADRAA